jgi:hypothetical protein
MTELNDDNVRYVVRLPEGQELPTEDPKPKPFAVAAQSVLFRGGFFGEAVQVWSKSNAQGGYEPTPVRINNTPVVVRMDSPSAMDEIRFAGGYICGWYESQGGTLEDLEIWLEQVDG